MEAKAWPAGDQEWFARYRASMAGKYVPPLALAERESELLDGVLEAGLPAVEIFGDAETLAAGDVADLATAEEAVRTSEGGGIRAVLREVGGTLLGIGAVATVLMTIRSGWFVDVDVANVLVGFGVLVLFVGWVIGRGCFSAGRPVSTAAVLVAAGAIALVGIVSAARLGPGHIAASDVPVVLLGVVLLAPGVTVLVVVSRMPQRNLRDNWSDAEWLSRFEGGLRARLVPAADAGDHVAEIRQALRSAEVSAHDEFGHPLVLARELADANRTARARRWWISIGTGTGTPFVIAALILSTGSWGPLTIPVVVVLLLGALITPTTGWNDRPWARRL